MVVDTPFHPGTRALMDAYLRCAEDIMAAAAPQVAARRGAAARTMQLAQPVLQARAGTGLRACGRPGGAAQLGRAVSGGRVRVWQRQWQHGRGPLGTQAMSGVWQEHAAHPAHHAALTPLKNPMRARRRR